jgi:hypothetical protein
MVTACIKVSSRRMEGGKSLLELISLRRKSNEKEKYILG